MNPASPMTLSSVKLALAVKKHRSEAAGKNLAASDPIAIVGIGCRFPGGASSPQSYWQLLRDGVDAVTEVPSQRWDSNEIYDPDPMCLGKSNGRWGGFVSNVDQFDPAFFGISPREAASMDPQQRLAIEVAWEAVWDGNYAPDKLAGTDTGIFVAVYGSDYACLSFEDLSRVGPHTCAGLQHSIASNRISYLLDLRGPSVSIDSACSSSLVSVALACQSLRALDCRMALAGGVNLRLTPEHYVELAKLGMLSPGGRCKTFDAAADGFVPGEGAGMVLLKRLSDALVDGDRVYAVIRGVAVNQDGRTNVLTAPSGLAQQKAVRSALQNAQVQASDVTYVETHGTGTSLGDPIEVEALAEVFGASDSGGRNCALGAVKTNIGHLEGAAGIAGLIKVALALKNEEIPGNLHFEKLNPHISLDGTRLFVPTKSTPWKRGGRARFAGVSSFGFGGTNAHVILEEATLLPSRSSSSSVSDMAAAYVLPISARTPDALRELAQSYRAMLSNGNDAIYDLCHVAACRRSHYPQRLAVTASTRREFVQQLDDFAQGHLRAGLSAGQGCRDAERIAFVCSGQGSQWAQMGVSLLADMSEFRSCMEECDELIRHHGGWSLLDEISAAAETSRLTHTEFAQPALFAIEVSLARLWQGWGIKPSAVIGHSAGEVAAACIAGLLPLETAVRVVVQRGRLMEAATGLGRMAVIHLPVPAVAKALLPYRASVSIAAINSPQSTVISGDSADLSSLLETWKTQGVGCRLMPVDYAFHSAQMQPFSEELERLLGSIANEGPAVAMISTVTGERVGKDELNAAYWGRNIRQPVLFASAVKTASDIGIRSFLEIGPHPVLLSSIGECLARDEGQHFLIPSLRRGQDGRTSLLTATGALYTAGYPVEWSSIYKKAAGEVTLPAYPYQRQRFWIDRRVSKPVAPGPHPLLSRKVRSAAIRGTVWETDLDLDRLPYLRDHRINGAAYFPMAGFVEMVGQAVAETAGSAQTLLDIAIVTSLVLSEEEPCTVQVVLDGNQFQVFSSQGDRWTLHASGRFGPLAQPDAADQENEGREEREFGASSVHYTRLRQNGFEFGPAFQTLTAISSRPGRTLARVRLGEEQAGEANRYRLHPALLDGCLQAAVAALDAEPETGSTLLPFGIARFETYAPAGSDVWACATFEHCSGKEGLNADIEVRNEAGLLLARIYGLRMKRREQSHDSDRNLYAVEWHEAKRGAPAGQLVKAWHILADDEAEAAALAEVLRQRGVTANITTAEELSRMTAHPGGILCLFGAETASAESVAGSRALTQMLAVAPNIIFRFAQQPPQLRIVTREAVALNSNELCEGIAQAPVWGFLRTLALEHPELRASITDLSRSTPEYSSLAEEMTQTDGEQETAFRNGIRYISRLVPRKSPTVEPRRWTISARGSIENLEKEALVRRAPKPGEVEIEVETTGLNFRDVLGVLGMYPGDPGPLGLEFCGRVARLGEGVENYRTGDRVMGLAWGSFGSFVTTPQLLIQPVPANLTALQAASIPNTFLTAYHCLVHLGGMKQGDRVLIHAATGGVGLAAVQLAQQAGAEIFATAGTDEKRAYLRSLGIHQVFNSRSVEFAREVAAATEGNGVDLILNSLAGEFIDASVSVLAEEGRFLEIGKSGVWTSERFASVRPRGSYFVVDLAPVIDFEPELIHRHLAAIRQEIQHGTLFPLPVHSFEFDETPLAFRFMAQARHMGKIVIRHPSTLPVFGNRSYWITGGQGAIGTRIAQWLAERGARHLILSGRHASEGAFPEALTALRSQGVRVEIQPADVAQRKDVEAVLRTIESRMPPLAGIVHCAGVLDDGIVAQQNSARAQRVLAPKVSGAWHLHELTADKALDFFILCSSVASLTGSPGQATYAAGNAFLDAVAHRRQALGLPALSVNWGPWAATGMAARLAGQGGHLGLAGLRPMSAETYLAALDRIAILNESQVAVASADWSRWNPQPSLLRSLIAHVPDQPRDLPADDINVLLEKAGVGKSRKVLVEYLRGQAQRILGLSGSHFIDEREPLMRMGLDSLMAVEFRNQLSAALKRSLSATLLFDHPTIASLADFLGGRSQETPAKTADPFVTALAELSDEEAEELLNKELERS